MYHIYQVSYYTHVYECVRGSRAPVGVSDVSLIEDGSGREGGKNRWDTKRGTRESDGRFIFLYSCAAFLRCSQSVRRGTAGK